MAPDGSSNTAAVTGAAGHVGGALVRELLARGYRVRAMVSRDRRALKGLELDEVQGDITDPDSLDRLFDRDQVVYHLAALISLDGDANPRLHEINVEGTRNVVQACLRRGVRRLVHFSSIHALEPEPLDAMVDEGRPLQLRNAGALPYDRSKALAEAEVLAGAARGLDAVILNPCGVVGPLDFKPSLLGDLLLGVCRQRLPALVAGGFSWVDVRDVAEAGAQAASAGRGGQRYILSGHWRTLQELAALVAREAGVRPPRITCPTWLARLGAPFAGAYSRVTGQRALYTSDSLRALVGYRHVARDRAEQELAFRARPLEETARDTVRWYRDMELL